MKIGFAQINSTVGDLNGNRDRILAAYRELIPQGVDLVVTPELSLTGYPPRDLLFAGGFVEEHLKILEEIDQHIGDVPLIVGFVEHNKTGHGKPFYNAAAIIMKGQPRRTYYKRLLPNDDVFDESRYFEPGSAVTIFQVSDCKVGLTICEDIWMPEYLSRSFYTIDPPAESVAAGAELIINISASPFRLKKPQQRLEMLCKQAQRLNVPIVYCNNVGGNDQLVFDGHSLAVAADGCSWIELQGCCEENKVLDFSKEQFSSSVREKNDHEELYGVLVMGLRDYCYKCRFNKVILGLSGGIDSAVVAVLAVAALGREAVIGILLPGPYSSEGSIEDALALAKNLGIQTMTLPITPTYEEMTNLLKSAFSGCPVDATEENIQARLRGVILMALSNKYNSLLLTTGNKSELAVGYCTLYGDMCGGLAVISDLLKTKVYELASWINREKEIIPKNSLEKAPSAELRPYQKDQDTLPPYEILDAILQRYLEDYQSASQIIAEGFDQTIVEQILKLVTRNEYKRQQAAPGLKVTGKAFGMGRRFPIAQKYRV